MARTVTLGNPTPSPRERQHADGSDSFADGKVMNRWWVVVGAILIQLALGALYAWSVFTPSLTKAPYDFTKWQTQVIFSVELAIFAFVMIVAGRLQARFRPRNVVALGGLVMGLGYIAASFCGTSFAGHVLCLGVIGGAGIGLGYVVPISVGVKWFPDKKGMLTGLAVAGFGFGALIWVKVAEIWLLGSLGVANVFLAYGILFAVLVLIGSIWMVNPPEGYKPAGWQGPQASPGKAASGAVNLSSSEMLRTPQFYALWLMFVAGAMAGLMVIGCIKLFGIDALKSAEVDEKAASLIAGTAMAVFYALANGLGRIIWGIISDRIGRKASLFLMLSLQGVVMLLFYQMGFHAWTLYLGAAVIGFNFGGNFALFPAATADFFGNKNVGPNYGWVFTAYGIGGIVGPILAGYYGNLVDEARKTALATGASFDPSAWHTPFLLAAVACLAAAVVALVLKVPSHKHSKAVGREQ